MKKRHYFLDINMSEQHTVHVLDSYEHVRHIRDIIRLNAGEEIVLTNGNGYGAIFKITKIEPTQIHIEKISEIKKQATQKVTLACAVLKGDHFELVVQKATELGVKHIVPLITERTIKTNIKESRIEKIIHEASEQSEQLTYPTLADIQDFKDWIEEINPIQTYLLDPSGIPYKDILKKEDPTIVIGPEGGWSPEELSLAQEKGITIISIGNTILRAETAAIVGVFWAGE